jgi:hypothetical protein
MTLKPIDFYVSNILPPAVNTYFQTLTWAEKFQLSAALSIEATDQMNGELIGIPFSLTITPTNDFEGLVVASIEDVAS